MKITVEINPTWARMVRSPIYYIVAALTGVSITFAPLFLYWSGKGKFFPSYAGFVVPLCFAVIFLIPSFYMWLGSIVVKELRRDIH